MFLRLTTFEHEKQGWKMNTKKGAQKHMKMAEQVTKKDVPKTIRKGRSG